MGDTLPAEVVGLDGEPFAINGRQSIGIVALALYWTWFFTIVFSESFLLPLPANLHIEPLFREVGFASMAFCYLVLTFFAKKLCRKRGLLVVLALALVASPWVCLFTACSVAGFSFPLATLVWALFGVSSALLAFCLALFAMTLKPRSTVLALGVSVTVGGIFYFLLLYMDLSAIWITVSALPLIAAICTWIALQNARQEGRADDDFGNDLGYHLASSLRIQPAQPLYGAIFSLVMGVGISISTLESGEFPLATSLAFCLAGPVMLAIALLPRKIDIGTLQWFLLPAAGAGLVFLGIDDHRAALACCAVLSFCYSFFEVSHTLSLVELMREQRDVASHVFASGKFWFFVGVCAGWGINIALLSVGYYSTVFNVAIMLMSTLVMIVLAWVGRPSVRNHEQMLAMSSEDSGAQWDDVCLDIAEEFGLSPRQTEVFLLLSKGRNAPYIEEELVVSYHTVKAHIYRIYQKLDVHTHQDLIDFVENRYKNA